MLAAAKAIKVVLNNKDVALLLNEDKEIFGIYEEVYDFILDYYQKHDAAPPASVLEDKFDEDLFDGVPDDITGATSHYLTELRNEYIKSSIENMLYVVGENLDKKPPNEVLERMSIRMAELSRLVTRSRDIEITDVDEALKHFKELRERKKTGRAGIKTGIEVWDLHAPNGLEPGSITLLIGYSSRGKSWIGGKIGKYAYECGKKVLVVSLEMNENQQRNRVWTMLANGDFHMRELQTAEVSDEKVLDFAEDHLNTGGWIRVVDAEGVGAMTPNVIRGKIEKHKPDLVIVDYYQLMSDNGKSKEMTPRMLNLSREMKWLARSTQIPIIGISAVTDDETTKKMDVPPTGEQVSWSKGLLYDADNVVAVHKYKDSDLIELAGRKVRDGELFNMLYRVDLSRGLFEPYYGEPNED